MSGMMINFRNVRAAAALSGFDARAAQARMAPMPRGMLPENKATPPREAGVLALIYPARDGLSVVLTRRAAHLRGHSGQISFPGGKRDPQDESFTVTALRETQEELGIAPAAVTVLGMLSCFYIPPSHFNVYPTVGMLDHTPVFQPNPYEVAEVFAFPLADLLDERFKHHEQREFNGFTIEVPYYLVRGHKVWGATAVMLSELEERLRHVL